MDAAGVSPKVASVLMGRQPGAASITLARYTHTMPDAIEIARALLDRWLLDRESASGLSPKRGARPKALVTARASSFAR